MMNQEKDVTAIFRGFSLKQSSMVFVANSAVAKQLKDLCPFSLPETVTSMVLLPRSEVAEQLKVL